MNSSMLPVSRPGARLLLVVVAVLVAAVAGATVAGAAPARVAAPAGLDFSFTGGGPQQNIELGASQGEPTCTGPATDQTCVGRIGTSLTTNWTTGIKDNGTGATGTLHGSCAVMYEGTSTTYTSRNGRADATGSEDCALEFDFGGGDSASGSMHEQRVLVDNVETNTFTLTITGGNGRFKGLNSVLTHVETNPWQASPPMGVRESKGQQSGGNNQQGGNQQGCNDPKGCSNNQQGGNQQGCNDPKGCSNNQQGGNQQGCNDPKGCSNNQQGGTSTNQQPGTTTPKSGTTTSALGDLRRLAAHHATPAAGKAAANKSGGGPSQRIVLKASAKPVADVTSLGLLAPANAASKVAVAASPGSTCSGSIAGPKTIELPKVTVAPQGGATVMRALPAGTFTAKAVWKLHLDCRTASGAETSVVRTLKGFTVTKK